MVHCTTEYAKKYIQFHDKVSKQHLPTRKNLYKWSLSDSPSCSFCLYPETLQQVVSSCKSYLEDERYTWRHNYVLLHIANSLSSLQRCRLFVDLPSFPSPLLITGDSLRPDLALISPDNTLYILELTEGFETNIEVNNKRKAIKYDPLIQDLRSQYRTITFINLSMSTLGIYEASSDTILNMMNDLGIAKSVQISIIKKIMNIAVRSTYYIFCRRNKTWTDPAWLHFALIYNIFLILFLLFADQLIISFYTSILFLNSFSRPSQLYIAHA